MDDCKHCEHLQSCRDGSRTFCPFSVSYCVINGRVAVNVEKTFPGAFYHCGAYYVYENRM